MNKYEQMASDILEKVGGKENVSNVAHCMTRLRLNLKDESVVNQEDVRSIEGVMGCQFTGGQFQVIIGPGTVDKVCDEVCKLGNFKNAEVIDENLDKPKEKFNPLDKKSWGRLGNKILDSIVGCLTPILPVLIAAGLIKMVAAIIAPGMLGLVSENSDIYRILTIVGDAGFYFFPVFVGWSGAKKFGCSPLLAMVIGGLLIHPDLISIANSGEPFSVFGIPMTAATYSSTVLPMILITWVMSYVEKFIKKISPEVISLMMVPTLTILIMVPLSLCVLGPIGAILGVYLSDMLVALYNLTGPFGVALIGAIYVYIVATGMHLTLITVALTAIATNGCDHFILVGCVAGTYAMIGMGIAVFLKAKNKQTKQVALSGTIAQAFGGVGEPFMYGILFRFKKLCVILSISIFIGGLWLGFNKAGVYFPGSNNFLAATMYGPDLFTGVIASVINFIAAFAMVMIFGFGEEDTNEETAV